MRWAQPTFFPLHPHNATLDCPGEIQSPGRHRPSMSLVEGFFRRDTKQCAPQERTRRPHHGSVANARQWFDHGDCSSFASRGYPLDEATWSSIEGDRLFERIDYCRSFLGSQYLYCKLRFPCVEATALDEHEAALDWLKQHPTSAGQLADMLSAMQDTDGWHVASLLKKPLPSLPFPAWVLWALPLVFHATLVFALIWGTWYWAAALCLFGACLYLHHRFSLFALTRTTAMFALRRVVQQCAQTQKEPALREFFSPFALQERLPALRSFRRGGWLADFQDPTGFLDYFKIISLYDARFYARQHRSIDVHRAALVRITQAMGYADHCLGILELRQRFANHTCTPDHGFNATFELQDCIHPLLDTQTAVANALCLAQPGALVTGLNMAGKSTFLRSVAINAILSQTIHTVFCTRYKGPLAKVFAVMNHADDLHQGKSYFMQELLSVRALVENAESSVPCLFVLDEMFRGTNSDERVASVAAVLDHLGQRKHLLVATHDMKVLDLVSQPFSLHHFSGRCGPGGDLHFEYQLRPGRCQERNAIRLMQKVGFPDQIVYQAQQMHDTVTQTPAATTP